MNLSKTGITLVIALFVLLAGIGSYPGDAGAAVLEKDSNPVKILFNSQGGVCLEREGQEKFFKLWNKSQNTFTTLNIPKTNIESFDLDDQNLAYIKNNDNYSTVEVYNLATGQIRTINAGYSNKKNVQIYGSYLAWQDYGQGRSDVALYNLNTGALNTLVSNYPSQQQPDLSDRYLVYLDYENGYKSIYLYDLQTGQKKNIRATLNDKSSLCLSGDRLIWAELNSQEGSASTSNPGDNYFDEVWGYATRSGCVYDIWMYNLSSGATTQLTNDSTNQVQPVIWGDYAAWADTSEGNPDIKLMDLRSGAITKLTSSDLYEVRPALGNGYVGWITMQGALADLNVQPLGTGNGSSTSSGTVVNTNIKVVINGSRYYMTPDPYLKQNRVMVPMRRIFDVLGASIEWNNAERSVTATSGSTVVKVFIGGKTAYRNGKPITLDVPAEINPATSSTMVPLRFVSEALDYLVNWDATTQTVTIGSSIF